MTVTFGGFNYPTPASPMLNDATPFTKRDSWTYLEKLEYLRRHTDLTLEEFEQIINAANNRKGDYEVLHVDLSQGNKEIVLPPDLPTNHVFYVLVKQGATGGNIVTLPDTLDGPATINQAPNSYTLMKFVPYGNGRFYAYNDIDSTIVYNVREYGAPGNGVADDGPGVRAAIAAAPPGSIVFFPSGFTYILKTLVDVNKPLTLRSPDSATITVDGNGRVSVSANDVTFDCLRFVKAPGPNWLNLLAERMGPALNIKGLVFRECVFVGLSVRATVIGRWNNNKTQSLAGTDIATMSLYGCEFTAYRENFTVEFGGTENSVVDSCWFHDYGLNSNTGDGVKINAGATGTRVTNSIFERTPRDGIDAFDSFGNIITGNNFRDCGAYGIDTKVILGGQRIPEKNVVSNNVAERCGTGGFHIATHYCSATNNQAYNCGTGYKINGEFANDADGTIKGVVFSDNLAVSSGSAYSFALLDGASITGNVAMSTTGVAFGFDRVTGSVITNNVSTLGGLTDFNNLDSTSVVMGNKTDKNPNVDRSIILPNAKSMFARPQEGGNALLRILQVTTDNDLIIGPGLGRNTRMSDPTVFAARTVRRVEIINYQEGDLNLDCSKADYFDIRLSAQSSAPVIANSVSGQEITITFQQDNAGSKPYAWSENMFFAGNTPPNNTTGRTRTSVTFLSLGNNWHEVSRAVAVPY